METPLIFALAKANVLKITGFSRGRHYTFEFIMEFLSDLIVLLLKQVMYEGLLIPKTVNKINFRWAGGMFIVPVK